jgi:hypothetical protein
MDSLFRLRCGEFPMPCHCGYCSAPYCRPLANRLDCIVCIVGSHVSYLVYQILCTIETHIMRPYKYKIKFVVN